MTSLPFRWTPRTIPLLPIGIVAEGIAALSLVRRLLTRMDEQLAQLAGVQAKGLLIVLSERV